jgi:hypothetical protein
VRAGGAEWLWLLDASVEPGPDALERLADVAEDHGPLPAPVLLASRVVAPGGETDLASLPVAEVLDPDLGAEACARRLLAVRVVRPGSLLVRRDVAGSPPLGGRGFLTWSARVLRSGPGLLVPTSVAVRVPGSPQDERRRARADLLGLAGLVTGDALAAGEKPWFAFHLAERALAFARPR